MAGVSFSLQVSSTDYIGNESTAMGYPVAFPVVSRAHIAVAVREPADADPVQLNGAQFQVVESGGSYSVVTAVAYTPDDVVSVYRLLPYDQPFDFAQGGPLRMEEIERAFDRVVMQVQQLWRDVTGGTGGAVLPVAGQSLQSLQVFDDAAAQALAVPDYAGQAGMRLSDLTLWMGSAVSVGQWAPVLPVLPAGHTYARSAGAFTAALAGVDYHTIHLAADIPIQGTVIIPAGKTVVPGSYKMTRSGSSYLQIWGCIEAGRRQIFSGFGPSHITGLFGSRWVYPEWWGLVADHHDIAINCAIKAAALLTNGYGLNISLAAGTYDVSSSLDLGGTACTLEGAGSNITMIRATRDWADSQWLKCEKWGDPALTTPNHGALIWIGAPVGSAYSYRTKIKGIDINCYYASYENRATYRISGISSRAGVEENTVIHDVTVSSASGFGIGFDRHKNPGTGLYAPATVNGLHISCSWILGPTLRDAVGIHFSQWTNNCRLETTTVDVGLAKSISSQYGTDTSATDATAIGTTIYPAPEWICDYMTSAIVAQGFVTISDVHIEGTILGVQILENSGANNVTVTNVKCYAMMDEALGAVYELDGVSGADPAANTDNYGYGCAVMIGGQGPAGAYPNDNWKDCVTLNNISSLGACPYLVRDSVYGVERTMFDMGQFPAGALAGRLAFYTRGNAWTGTGGVAVYNKAAPSTDRVYFLGPIY